MPSIIIPIMQQKQVAQAISKGKRLDGRGLTDYREVQLETGIVSSAEGSARVHLGKTDVLVGIKIERGQPFSDTPDKGVLTVNAELSPLASSMFEPGPPGVQAIELARVVDRGIRESEAIAVEKLCVIPGKKVFVVFIDIYVLNYDGNLIDASAMAALAALLNTKMFKYELKDGEIEIKPGYTKLPVKDHPIAVTIAKINDILIVDPALDEEQVMDARLTMTLGKDGRVCAIQKGGSGHFTAQQILEAAKIVQEKSGEIRKLLVKD
ncbi:MAG: exosome complex protein Rrp42 [Candidatus Bathyarchaeota archaeon]|nr:MAG: exosome complex protein Rrp42 [Candidatus Bathyarchaeota archaeon]